MSGLGDKLKGSAKEAAGKVVKNKKLEAEGKTDQIKGNLKEKADKAKDKLGDKVNKSLDKVKRKTDDKK